MTHGHGLFSPLTKAEIGGVEERARGIVHQRPAVARNQAGPDGLLGFAAERSIERARGALRLPVSAWPGCQVTCLPFRVKVIVRFSAVNLPSPVGVNAEASVCGVQQRASLSLVRAELRHRQAAVEEDQRGVVFELAVGGPLHADQLRRQDGEAGVAEVTTALGSATGL